MESQTQAEQTQQIKDFILSMKCIFDKNFTPAQTVLCSLRGTTLIKGRRPR